MTTLTPQSGQLSLIELANRLWNGKVMPVAEVLNEVNQFLADAVFLEANAIGGHTLNRRTSLPTGGFRKINDGIAAESSETRQITETIGMLEAFSQIDEALVELAGDKRAYRALEDMAFIEGLGQTLADTLIYGDTAGTPEQFKGLAPRTNALANANTFGASGTGEDTTSLWVIKWGPRGAYFIYPKGSQAGLSAQDQGLNRVAGTTGTFMAWVTHFKMKVGLAVADDRAIQRIANMETTGTANIFSEDLLIAAINRMSGINGNPAILCNATIKTQLDIAAKDKSNVSYTIAEYGGREVTFFKGIPVRQVDSIVDTETAIT